MKTFKPFKNKQVIDLKDMKIYEHVTHGDLVIYKIKEGDVDSFESLEKVDLGVLAEGEAHAHAHQLHLDKPMEAPAFKVIEGKKSETVFDLRRTSEGNMYLKIEGDPLLLKHQTHNPMRLYSGWYDVDFQQETDHTEEIRRVID